MTDSSTWIPAVTIEELKKRRKLKIETEAGELVLVWDGDRPHAMANICVHQDRELVKGNVLLGRLVCPGHQWAFDLETGYCRERDRTQPVHETRVEGGIVQVRAVPAATD